MPFVYSTTTCDGTYIEYKPDLNKNQGFSEAIRKVTIKGGHGVATRHLVTPKGVVTEVTQDDLDFLLKNASFQKHMEAGFISYDNSRVEPEKRAADMAQADGSAPLTPADFVESDDGSKSSRIYKGKARK